MTGGIAEVGTGPDPSPVVVRLTLGGRDVERARVVLSDETEYTVALDAVLELGLRTDDPVDDQLRARLVDLDLRFRARDHALSLLARRARSRRELSDRLRRKEIPARIVARVLDRLEAGGLLDDAAFARAFIRDRLRFRPRGRRALATELRRKGVSASVIDAALDEAFAELETTDRAVADEVAEGWLRRQPAKIRAALQRGPFDEDGAKAWRRGLGHMARKGFGAGLARGALERALGA